jgi:hypothetical protein
LRGSGANVQVEDSTAPTPVSTVDPQRAEWVEYRAACFIRSGVACWVWSAAHEFEFRTVGLYLIDVPGARVDVGTHAIALIAHDEIHIVPIVRCTADSLEHMQAVAANPLAERKTQLRDEQIKAEQAMRDLVGRQVLFKAAPGSLNGTVQ